MEEQRWVPTHVQVTVLRATGLRGKGKQGTSDAYAIIQLGKEKYSTGVVERSTEPEWAEECSFELPPGALDGGYCPLLLTVMHRALIGLDVFLGQAALRLDEVFTESRGVKSQWYRLHSKTGKKEKERGDIQVTVQFTRNNLTASMYDLVMKDKGTSTFSKLKERIRGKRRSSEDDSSSGVLPGGYGSLYRMRQRLPSDGGGEEDYEDDEGGEARRSKMRTFFLRGKLRKSSDTRSSTSLGSESSESSSRGGSLSPTAGISVVVSDLSNSPSNSSNLTADNSPEHTANTSPRSSSLRCDFGDEAGEIAIAVPQPAVCANGSHALRVPAPDPGSGTPAEASGLGQSQKPLPLSMSLQNLAPRASSHLQPGPVGDGRRWSFDKPDEEEKAAIAAALEQSGPMRSEEDEEEEEGRVGQAAVSTAESESQGKKQRRNIFSHAKGQSLSKDGSEDAAATAAAEQKNKGWFGSKEPQSKPSPVMSPNLDPRPPPLPSTDPPSTDPPSTDPPPGSPVDFASLVSSLHHSNPFCRSQAPPSLISPRNPFFSVLQHNPFYEDMLTAPPLKPSPPPLPYLSSSRPAVAQLFVQGGHPQHNLTHNSNTTTTLEDAVVGATHLKSEAVPVEEEKALNKMVSGALASVGNLDPEWDESFEVFAAGRLMSPEDLTTRLQTQQNAPSEPNHKPEGALVQQHNTDVIDSPHSCSQETGVDSHHLDTFARFLDPIPEHMSFMSDTSDSRVPQSSESLRTETNHTNITANAHDSSSTNTHTSSAQLNSSPDPGSSGLGSSAEEDFLSCLSSYSDKFSASSFEEAEPQNLESNIRDFGTSPESPAAKNSKPSESNDELTELDTVQQTVIWQQDTGERADSNHPLLPTSPVDTETPQVIPDAVFPDLLLKLEDDGRGSDVVFDGSSGNNGADVKMLTTPDVEFASTLPSLHVLTSSPDVKQSSWDSPLRGSSLVGQCSPVPFGGFGVTGPDPDFDGTLLHVRAFDQSSNSFLQSLYVTTDSQNYQTCESQPSSRFSSASEPDQAAQSGNSTLCGELSDLQTTAEVAAQSAALHRSQSEGTLTVDELLLAPFGTESSSDQRGHNHSVSLPCLTSSAPPLTPTSSPVALSSLPSHAGALAPPGSTRAAAATAPEPQETQQQQEAAGQENSPHPVKPLASGAAAAEERRAEGRSVLATGLEKLKFSIHPGRSSQAGEQHTDRKKSLTEGAGSYYHLTHSELAALLARREAELERQRAEFERQRLLLAKREAELKKLKPQIRDLEDYIDTLLVRIMEQKPTLLQVRTKFK